MAKRKPKPKTQAQIDKTAHAHRQKKYGVGLDYYNDQLERQGGGCAICGSPPGTRRLHIDHDHGWAKVRIYSQKGESGWSTWASYLGKDYCGYGKSKSTALREVKDQLKRASVRGLLSYSCNAGLQKFKDDPRLLRAAAAYLEAHQEGK